jgi:hypothetical protein
MVENFMGFFLPADAAFRRLTWADYRRVDAPAPTAGQTRVVAAQTAVAYQMTPNVLHFDRAPFLKGPSFVMREDPNVSVELDANGTFVESWVFARPLRIQNALLAHEQGHYEICMLNARDFFFGLQDIQDTAFATAKEGTNAVSNLDKQLWNVEKIQAKYDSDTDNGNIPSMQTVWISALSNARITFVRPSLRVALANAGLLPSLQ